MSTTSVKVLIANAPTRRADRLREGEWVIDPGSGHGPRASYFPHVAEVVSAEFVREPGLPPMIDVVLRFHNQDKDGQLTSRDVTRRVGRFARFRCFTVTA